MSFISARKLGAVMLPLVIASTAIAAGTASARTTHSGASLQACALLPDTKSSTRYTLFDAPYLTAAFKKAGISAQVLNAQGDSARQKSQAEGCLAKGAKVILLDPFTTAAGTAITAEAVSQGAKVIDYDRLVPGSKVSYYVSFDNVLVGKMQAKGLIGGLKAAGHVCQEARDRRAQRRHHGQQRPPLQAGLRLRPQPAVQERRAQEGDRRRPVDGLGSGQGPHDLRPDGSPQQQRHPGRAGRQRRPRRRGHRVAAGPRPQADPAHGPGRDADRRPVHPRRLADGHGLQGGPASRRTPPRRSRSTSSRARPSRRTARSAARRRCCSRPIWLTKANYKKVFTDGFLKKSAVCTGKYAQYCK